MSDIENCEFLDAANDAVEQLKKLSKEYPHLVTKPVLQAIENWDDDLFRRGELIWEEYQRVIREKNAVELRVMELVDTHHVDDTIDIITNEFGKEFDYYDLINIAGKDRYIEALTREAAELKINSVSPEQTADLWNSSGKPTIGGDRWNATAVSVLFG